jgi:ferredoxin
VAPETVAPETVAPETVAPETVAPETVAGGGVVAILERADFPALLEVLKRRGHAIVGPTLADGSSREGAIVYAPIGDVRDLPEGWTDDQDAGSYRLKRREDRALFGYVVGPHSWKRWFLPPELRLWRAKREGHGFEIQEEDAPNAPIAIIGARPCELAALRIQDRVFLEGPYADPHYLARRRGAFIVAVDCTEPGETCFCASMGTGPHVTATGGSADGGPRGGGPRGGGGYDLALTEIVAKDRHWFAVRVGTEAGADVLREVPHAEATAGEARTAEAACLGAAEHMGRRLETKGLRELLYASMEHPEWEAVTRRCMACGNCTLVCPTCFCTTVEDATDLTGSRAERWRRWDSCFTRDFSYIYGGQIRRTVESRYRQWLTHKLAYWQDQFGTSGCVGCGRCITWCPVGIDITEEVRSIRSSSAHG